MINKLPEKVKVWSEFGLLALIVMLPLLFPGYILTLDLVFTPHMPWPDVHSPDFLLKLVLWLLYHILSGDIIEKLVLFSILIASGAGMYLLIKKLARPPLVQADVWRLAAYVAGIFYMINPFIYARFMAGQWMVLLGYALTPLFLGAFIAFMRQPSMRTSLKAALWAIAISATSLHHTGITVLFVIIILCAAIFTNRHNVQRLIEYAKWGAMGASLWILANLHWLIPIVSGKGELARSVSGFDQAHFAAFATLGGALNVFQLQGFWAEAQRLFLLPQQLMPVWGLCIIALWAVVVYGAVKLWRYGQKRLVIVCGVAMMLAVLLAATPLVMWLSAWLPFAAGYREPHKFVNIIVICFAVLLAYGAAYSIQRQKGRRRDAILSLFFLLPVLTVPTMFGGFAGQLTPRQYPQEWYEANRVLKADDSVRRVLFLPWHQYANYSFSGRIIANPAEKFFEVPVIQSDDPEFKNISPTTPRDDKQRLTEAVHAKKLSSRPLEDLSISHILLAKEQDWEEYRLMLPPSLKLLFENDKMLMYRVK